MAMWNFQATSEKKSKCIGKILFTAKIIYQAFRNLFKGEPVTFTHFFQAFILSIAIYMSYKNLLYFVIITRLKT